jgi:hypothetical protein
MAQKEKETNENLWLALNELILNVLEAIADEKGDSITRTCKLRDFPDHCIKVEASFEPIKEEKVEKDHWIPDTTDPEPITVEKKRSELLR